MEHRNTYDNKIKRFSKTLHRVNEAFFMKTRELKNTNNPHEVKAIYKRMNQLEWRAQRVFDMKQDFVRFFKEERKAI